MTTAIYETLAKYDIHPQQVAEWEEALELRIPTDAHGQKQYTRQHLNLFKNIKKHIALGRSLNHIKHIITLPPTPTSQPVSRSVYSRKHWQNEANELPKASVSPVEPKPLFTNLPKIKETPTPLAPNGLSLESEALLETFKTSASHLIQTDVPNDASHPHVSESLEHELNALQIDIPVIEPTAIEPCVDAPPIEDLNIDTVEIEAITPNVGHKIDTNTNEKPMTPWTYTPAIMSPEEALSSIRETSAELTMTEITEILDASAQEVLSQSSAMEKSSVIEKVSQEASPVHHLTTASAVPMAIVHESQEQSLKIVDRLLTEKDALQTRLVEAEKLNSHLYNVNNLFNKKVKELTKLVSKMKDTYNENDLMKLMDDKAKLQRQLLDAEKDRLDAQRDASKARENEKYAVQAQLYLSNELKAQRHGFEGHRFLGNWRESLKLREIQYDTFGLNVESERSQHRLIDSTPTRIVGNVAFMTTRYAYPDNDLWQRLETLTFVFMEENKGQGELQVDYILDGIPVCRAIYTAHLERIS